MHNIRLDKLPIYINCILYLFVSIMLINSIRDIIESNASLANVNVITILLFSFIILFLIIVSYGLLTNKKWARVMAISWNLAIAFLLIGLKLIIYIMADSSLNISGYFSYYSLMQIVIGFILIFLSFLYIKENKEQVNK